MRLIKDMKKIILTSTFIALSSIVISLLFGSELLAGDAKISQTEYKKLQERLAKLEKKSNQSKFNSAPEFKTSDGKFSLKPIGRMHFDATWFGDDSYDNADNTNLRRARLGFKGKLPSDFAYQIEVDFGSEKTNFKKTYLRYDGLKHLTGLAVTQIAVGNIKPSHTLSNMISSNNGEFLERAPTISTFARSEINGATINVADNAWSAGFGIFTDDSGYEERDDEQWSIDGRFTLAPIQPVKTGDLLVHLGASASLRTPRTETDSMRFRSRGGSGSGNYLIDTGNIAAVDNAFVYGLELASIYHALSFQTEYLQADISRGLTNPDVTIDSWYAQIGYWLTGENRPYKVNHGKFGKVIPFRDFDIKNGGDGAWQIALRYNLSNLTDKNIRGGELETWTLALNWHLNRYMRLMTNYVTVDTDRNAAFPNDSPNIFLLRFQLDF